MAYTDLPGRSLQNDVSLMLQDPTGRKIAGNTGLPTMTNSDVDHNVEVIRIDDPAPGRWLIQFFARNLLRPSQDYALVATGALPSRCDGRQADNQQSTPPFATALARARGALQTGALGPAERRVHAADLSAPGRGIRQCGFSSPHYRRSCSRSSARWEQPGR